MKWNLVIGIINQDKNELSMSVRTKNSNLIKSVTLCLCFYKQNRKILIKIYYIEYDSEYYYEMFNHRRSILIEILLY